MRTQKISNGLDRGRLRAQSTAHSDPVRDFLCPPFLFPYHLFVFIDIDTDLIFSNCVDASKNWRKSWKSFLFVSICFDHTRLLSSFSVFAFIFRNSYVLPYGVHMCIVSMFYAAASTRIRTENKKFYCKLCTQFFFAFVWNVYQTV